MAWGKEDVVKYIYTGGCKKNRLWYTVRQKGLNNLNEHSSFNKIAYNSFKKDILHSLVYFKCFKKYIWEFVDSAWFPTDS